MQDTEARVNAVLQNQVKVIQQMDKHAQELQEKIQEYESTLQPLVETYGFVILLHFATYRARNSCYPAHFVIIF